MIQTHQLNPLFKISEQNSVGTLFYVCFLNNIHHGGPKLPVINIPF